MNEQNTDRDRAAVAADVTRRLNQAVDILESRIWAAPDYLAIEKETGVGAYHFQRVFTLLAGCTVGQYLRARRLSLAAEELYAGKKGVRVIDMAYEYGYESLTAFSRAFLRFHGCTPGDVLRHTSDYRRYPKLRFDLRLH